MFTPVVRGAYRTRLLLLEASTLEVGGSTQRMRMMKKSEFTQRV